MYDLNVILVGYASIKGIPISLNIIAWTRGEQFAMSLNNRNMVAVARALPTKITFKSYKLKYNLIYTITTYDFRYCIRKHYDYYTLLSTCTFVAFIKER